MQQQKKVSKKINNMDGKSRNLTEDYIEQIKILFPEVVTEVADKDGNNPTHKVDMEKLSILLGEAAIPTDDAEYRQKYGEKFTFEWSGKIRAIAEAQKRSTGTLRPCPEESLDWDTTENLYIEGDNLEVLKLLQDSYLGAVKMIYIDPPYNTGNDFVYKDNYKDNLSNYLEQTNTTNAVNSEASGRYHTNWLNMMYPRLKLARNLLTDDGIIFISIDDNEVSNLKSICNEIFGEENFVTNFLWKKKGTTSNVKGAQVSSLVDSTLCFRKSKNAIIKPRVTDKETRSYPYRDNEGFYRTTVIEKKDSGGYKRDSMKFEIIGYLPREGRRWQIGKKTAEDLEQKKRFIFDGEKILLKIYDFEDKDTTSARPNLLFKHGSTDSAASIIKMLFDGKEELFDNPKPVELIRELINFSSDNNDIILDFFSGSATTANAVMQLNVEEGGNRKYICVQLPEQVPEGSEACKFLEKLGKPTTIPEIAKERIRRAGKKILEEQNSKNEGLFAEETPKLDVGFKVFKLDRSNVKNWDVEVEGLSEKEVQEALSLEFEKAMEILKDGRTELDLLYEVMLKLGLKLTTNVEEVEIDSKSVYLVGDGVMVASFAKNITYSHVSKILDLKPDFIQSGEFKVVFADESFASDNDKTNAMQLLKQRGITNFEII